MYTLFNHYIYSWSQMKPQTKQKMINFLYKCNKKKVMHYILHVHLFDFTGKCIGTLIKNDDSQFHTPHICIRSTINIYIHMEHWKFPGSNTTAAAATATVGLFKMGQMQIFCSQQIHRIHIVCIYVYLINITLHCILFALDLHGVILNYKFTCIHNKLSFNLITILPIALMYITFCHSYSLFKIRVWMSEYEWISYA